MMDLIGLLLFFAFLSHQERKRALRTFKQRVRRPQPSYRMSTREREYSDALAGIRRRGPEQNVVINLRPRVAANAPAR